MSKKNTSKSEGGSEQTPALTKSSASSRNQSSPAQNGRMAERMNATEPEKIIPDIALASCGSRKQRRKDLNNQRVGADMVLQAKTNLEGLETVPHLENYSHLNKID